jgi:hypothetical protein
MFLVPGLPTDHSPPVPSKLPTIKASFPTVGHGGEYEKEENANLSQNPFP